MSKKDAGLWLAKQFWDPPRDVQVELADFWCGTLWSIGGPQGGMWKLTDPSKGVLQYQLRGFFGHHCHTFRARIPGNDHGDLRLTPKHILGVRGPWGHFHILTKMAVFGRFWATYCQFESQDYRNTFGFVLRPLEVEIQPFKDPMVDPKGPQGAEIKNAPIGSGFFFNVTNIGVANSMVQFISLLVHQEARCGHQRALFGPKLNFKGG